MQFYKSTRFVFFLFFDVFLCMLSLFLASLLRFSGDIPSIFYQGIVKAGIILIILKIIFLCIFKIYRVPWSFFSLNEARKIFLSLFLAQFCFLILFYFFHDFFHPFARSIIAIDFILSYMFIGALRISKRMLIDLQFFHFDKKDKACILIGATSRALHLLKGAKEGSLEFFPVGVVDPRKELIGTYCDQFMVEDKHSIKDYVNKGVKTAIIALKLNQAELRILFEELRSYGIRDVKIFSLTKNGTRDLSIEDLLARKVRDLDDSIVSSFLKDRVVLVSGAGGTIGSELCKQCIKFGVKHLIMLDHSEFNLYSIGEKLHEFEEKISPILLSILDEQGVDSIIKEYKPQVILHAAAYKHVPLCEKNPYSAVLNNIIGTKILCDKAKKYGVKKFVMISTDKAVRPINIMGCTKRVCELYTLSSSDENFEVSCVRFGNVLGSSGSVIPKFKTQIENNEALTLTHPDIMRYFMLVSEAVQLVLQAAAIAKGGELFVLDMGKPIKIMDLAKKMLILANKEHLQIKIVGLRPGEKLFEELLIDENNTKTVYESIYIAKHENRDITFLNTSIKKLGENEDIIAILKQIVPEFDYGKKHLFLNYNLLKNNDIYRKD